MSYALTGNAVLQLALYLAVLFALAWPLGLYMARILAAERLFLAPVENAVYGALGIKPGEDMSWKAYATAVIVFSFGGFVLLYLLLLFQSHLGLNPQGMANLTPDLAFNTAVSFVTNTNWQSYAGESTMSYASQMIGLTVQNFLSAAVGIAVMAALIRGLSRQSAKGIGNFWVDLVRSTLYVLLPLALIWAVLLGSQGVIQTLNGPYAGRCATDLGPGTGGFTGSHKNARHQWWRCLQHQFSTSIRKPDAALQLPRSLGHPADSGGLLLRLRQDDR